MGRLAAALAAIALPACAGDPAREADRPYTAGLARVESVEVRVRNVVPVRVRAVVRGTLPDPCTALEPPRVRRSGSVFEVELATRRRSDVSCAQVVMPFERRISLDVPDVPAAYFVNVNGVSQGFTVHPSPAGRPVLERGDFD